MVYGLALEELMKDSAFHNEAASCVSSRLMIVKLPGRHDVHHSNRARHVCSRSRCCVDDIKYISGTRMGRVYSFHITVRSLVHFLWTAWTIMSTVCV